jgi:16S rRNA (guanine(966)-N(2))-methyltransferase RsmD
MRVVAGSAKGRRLKGPATPGTRPVMDRVKTALFDILAPDIEGTRFLDLFAGTGSIGIEALSRGAEVATFVELSPEALKLVRENLAITKLGGRAETVCADAFRYLERARADGTRFDIVYVAPPQYAGMAARAVRQLDRAPLTREGDLVIAQIHPRERGELDALQTRRLRRYDERRYGSTLLVFYEDVRSERDEAGEDTAGRSAREAEAGEHEHDEPSD